MKCLEQCPPGYAKLKTSNKCVYERYANNETGCAYLAVQEGGYVCFSECPPAYPWYYADYTSGYIKICTAKCPDSSPLLFMKKECRDRCTNEQEHEQFYPKQMINYGYYHNNNGVRTCVVDCSQTDSLYRISSLGKPASCEAACSPEFPYSTETSITTCQNIQVDEIDSLKQITCIDGTFTRAALYACNDTCETQYYIWQSSNLTTQPTLRCQESCQSSYYQQKNLTSELIQCVERCSTDRVIIARECGSVCP